MDKKTESSVGMSTRSTPREAAETSLKSANDQSLVDTLRQLFEGRNTEPSKVKISKFWQNRPALWFVILENEFTAVNIRNEDAKYTAIIRHLDEKTIIAVSDVLENPPAIGKYELLKRH